MRPFDPLFTNPHLQTLAGHYWPRPFDARRFPVERVILRTEPDVQVLVEKQQGGGHGDVVPSHAQIPQQPPDAEENATGVTSCHENDRRDSVRLDAHRSGRVRTAHRQAR